MFRATSAIMVPLRSARSKSTQGTFARPGTLGTFAQPGPTKHPFRYLSRSIFKFSLCATTPFSLFFTPHIIGKYVFWRGYGKNVKMSLFHSFFLEFFTVFSPLTPGNQPTSKILCYKCHAPRACSGHKNRLPVIT